MSIFLIRYVLKIEEVGAPRSILHIFLIRYALKTYGSRPGVPKRI
jgi:hypothetical protein